MVIPLTVALTTYNRSHYLKESLAAILNQAYRDFELLVLDNGSTDDTPYVVLGFDDERLRYIRNAPGYTSRFNSLSAQLIARGERLLITHDDDIMEPEMLERQMALIAARPELTAVWTNTSIIDEHGTVVRPWLIPPGTNQIFERGEYIARGAEEELWSPPSSMIFRPQLLSIASLYRIYLEAPEARQRLDSNGSGDHIRPALMNLKGPVAFLNEPLLRYRKHTVQETNHVHVARAALHRYQTFRKFVRKTDFREEYEPMFDAQIARFQAQDLLINLDQPALDRAMSKRLVRLLGKGSAGIASNPRVGHPLLPLILLLMQTGVTEIACPVLDGLEAPNARVSRSIRLLYRWAQHRRTGGNIFAGVAPRTNVVILGSVFVSALLMNEARQVGLNIVCCLDSNITRQGRRWLGVPIVPPAWLASRDVPIDLVVLSSERDHEEEMKELIRRHDPDTPIVSWKELVERANYFSVSLHGESAQ